MRIELLTIGREILDGRVIDTNSVFIAEKLNQKGLVARFATRVDDHLERIVQCFQIASTRADIVLVTGGLGPTEDDLTAKAFAEFADVTLEKNKDAEKQVRDRFEKIKRPLTEVQIKQAFLPRGAQVLENSQGTAPGFYFKKENCTFYFMPGVPLEMKVMFTEKVLPLFPQTSKVRSATWLTQFTSEGKLQEKLFPCHDLLPAHFEITYRTRFPENHIGLVGEIKSKDDEVHFDLISKKIKEILGDDVFESAEHPTELRSLEKAVVDLLAKTKSVVCTVESCTGGGLANRFTNVAGSSTVFWGGLVTYENSAKELLAEVAPELLVKHGAVSKEVAAALAEGALEKLKQGIKKFQNRNEPNRPFPEPVEGLYSLVTTGVAGPGGGTAEKPVGLCYLALGIHRPNGISEIKVIEARSSYILDRDRNKILFCQKALELLRRELRNENNFYEQFKV